MTTPDHDTSTLPKQPCQKEYSEPKFRELGNLTSLSKNGLLLGPEVLVLLS
jgi:hypothetical protein